MGDRSGTDGQDDIRSIVDRRPLGGLADLADLLGGESDRSRRFLGGVIAGALVGAAVAGASVLRRRSAGRHDRT